MRVWLILEQRHEAQPVEAERRIPVDQPLIGERSPGARQDAGQQRHEHGEQAERAGNLGDVGDAQPAAVRAQQHARHADGGGQRRQGPELTPGNGDAGERGQQRHAGAQHKRQHPGRAHGRRGAGKLGQQALGARLRYGRKSV